MDTAQKIKDKEQLVEWFKDGFKPRQQWMVGTEHEKFAYTFSKEKKKYVPVSYHGPNGIQDFLTEISNHGWVGIYEGQNIVALKKDSQSITL